MTSKFYLLIIILFISVSSALAQDSLDVHFNGLGFLDNREYKTFVERSRTYSGARTELDFGLNMDSLNHFVVGVNGIHEFGAQPYFLKVDPVAYYSFKSAKWLFNAGMFPRAGLLDNYPRALLNDTLMYYRPNVEGLLARYSTKNGYETGWLDWVSRQTATAREQFLFGAEGKFLPDSKGSFYISNYFLLMHDAGPAVPIPNDHIRDNGGAQVRLGLDLTRHTSLDSLAFEAGGMISLERTRGFDQWRIPKGFVAAAYIAFLKRFAVRDEFYAGQGHYITYGDSYYEKKVYNRMDMIFTPFDYKHIKGQFILSLHFSPGQFNDNQEAFRVTYDLGRQTIKRFNGDR
jgi:hypothetical protein